MNPKLRIAIAALSLSAAGLVGLIGHEGYTDSAVVPTKGDRPTVGFGSTFREDGSAVQMGDKTNPVAALQRTLAYTVTADAKLKACVKAPLHQVEFDLLQDHGYQYGLATTCKSPMVRESNAGNYAGSCAGYLEYRYMTSPTYLGPGWVEFKKDVQGRAIRWRFDCSTPGNKQCWGVWARSKDRYDKCLAVQ